MPQPTDAMEARHVLQLVSGLGLAVGSIGATLAALDAGDAEGIQRAQKAALEANEAFVDGLERIGQHYGG